ncbi:MAG: GumC family protein [Methyloligellaceae bacterium]
MSQENSEEENPFQLDVNYLWSVLKRRKLLIILPIVFGFALYALVLNLLPPVYEAKAIVAYDPGEKQIIEAEDKRQQVSLKYTLSKLQAEVQIMQSLLVLKRVVKKLNLHNSPEFLASSRMDQIKKRVKSWLGEEAPADQARDQGGNLLSSSSETSADAERNETAMINSAVSKLQEGLSIEADRYTFLITITYTSTNPELAAIIANEVPQAHFEHQQDNRLATARRASEWLEMQREKARLALVGADRDVETFRDKFKLVDETGQSEYHLQLGKVRASLEDVQSKTLNIKIKLEELTRAFKSSKQDLSAFNSPLMARLRNQLAEAQNKEAEVKARLGSKHPAVRNVLAEINDIKRQLKAESSNILRVTNADYDLALKGEAALKVRAKELEKKSYVSKEAATKYRQLLSSTKIKRDHYLSLDKRIQEVAELRQLVSRDFRVVSKALVPTGVSAPNWIILGFAAFIVSAGFGVGIAGGLEFLDSRLRTIKQVERATRLPAISVLPKLPEKSVMFLHKGNSEEYLEMDESILIYSEAINDLKTEVQLVNKERKTKSIIITSPSMNEGKSMLALAFAQHMSKLGVNTLLIDCDLRRPSILNKLGKAANYGLADVLSGKVELEEAVIVDGHTGLHILPTVTPTGPSASEILGSNKMKEFIEAASEKYDFVLMDTAPLLPVQDTRALAVNSDAIILVTAWGETKTADARKAVEKLASVRTNILGAVLNKSDLQTLTSHYTGVYGYIT